MRRSTQRPIEPVKQPDLLHRLADLWRVRLRTQRLIRQREDLRAAKEHLPDPGAMKPQGLRALSQLNRQKT